MSEGGEVIAVGGDISLRRTVAADGAAVIGLWSARLFESLATGYGATEAVALEMLAEKAGSLARLLARGVEMARGRSADAPLGTRRVGWCPQHGPVEAVSGEHDPGYGVCPECGASAEGARLVGRVWRSLTVDEAATVACVSSRAAADRADGVTDAAGWCAGCGATDYDEGGCCISCGVLAEGPGADLACAALVFAAQRVEAASPPGGGDGA